MGSIKRILEKQVGNGVYVKSLMIGSSIMQVKISFCLCSSATGVLDFNLCRGCAHMNFLPGTQNRPFSHSAKEPGSRVIFIHFFTQGSIEWR